MESGNNFIYDRLEVTHKVVCYNCGYEGEGHDMDDYEAVDYFAKSGWSGNENGCLCPFCTNEELNKL